LVFFAWLTVRHPWRDLGDLQRSDPMRKQTVSLTLLAALALPGTAHAALIERLGGDAFYDDVLDITWLTDANLAASNTFGVAGINLNGSMTWNTANAWIAGMNAADHLGFDDWRLPTLSPIDGVAFDTTFSNNATTDLGNARTTTDGSDGGWRDGAGTPVSEMGYMYYVNLGNLGFCTPNDVSPGSCVAQAGSGLANTADFMNLQSGGGYWSGVEFDSGNAWHFLFLFGDQRPFGKNLDRFAWAVRSGDVEAAATVPEPATAALLGASLIGFAAARRRARRPGASVL
jgi:hypothetical protein